MEIRERLLQYADWCNSHDALHERLKHIAADLRDSVAEIDSLNENRDLWIQRDRDNTNTIAAQRKEMDRLREQVQIKETAASDLELFRKDDQKRADAVILGMTMAIRVMAEGLSAKGGK
jgi:hypothetical protein